jgi:hypothetical protein
MGKRMTNRTLFVALFWILSTASWGFACLSELRSDPTTVVAGADLILRVTAGEYYGIQPPQTERRLWNSNIRFSVDEVVKGTYAKPDLILPGFLTDRDDWNDRPVPYKAPRPEARGGGCFANGYRKGGHFLLMLKRWDGSISYLIAGDPQDGYTVNWFALGPVNEQLRSANDPWVVWVREQVR